MKKQKDSSVFAALSYLFGAVTGVIFYFLKKDDDFVRFHAMQSILWGIGVVLIGLALQVFAAIFTVATFGIGFFIGAPLIAAYYLASFVSWLFLMYKAFSGEEYMFPVVGKMAKKYVK